MRNEPERPAHQRHGNKSNRDIDYLPTHAPGVRDSQGAYHQHELHPSHHHLPHAHPTNHRALLFGLLFLLITLLAISSIIGLASARLASNIVSKSGLITTVEIHMGRVYSRRGGGTSTSAPFYAYNELRLAGDSNAYIYFRDEFSPSLPSNLAQGGGANLAGEIWYVESLYPVPFRLEIVAIQTQEPGALHPERFVTPQYTSPQPTYAPGLTLGGLAALLFAAFIWSPTGRSLATAALRWSAAPTQSNKPHRRSHVPLATHAASAKTPHRDKQ